MKMMQRTGHENRTINNYQKAGCCQAGLLKATDAAAVDLLKLIHNSTQQLDSTDANI